MVDNKIISIPNRRDIEDKASVWVVRHQEGDMTPARLTEFRAWMSQSAQHREVFEELAKFYGGLDFVEGLQDYAETDALQAPLALDRRAKHFYRLRRVFVVGMAASVAAVFVGATYTQLTTPSNQFEESYATLVGEQKTVNLPDGSTIVLNTNSKMAIAFDRNERRIEMTRGEAFFEVAKDEVRPFSVETEKGVVTAVGTAFSVHLRGEKLDVVVTEGRVALEAMSSIAPGADKNSATEFVQAREVSAGQSAVMDRGVEEIAVVQPAALEKAMDWQDGELSFEGETLETVVADISRYTDLKIEIGDQDLREQRIVAHYRVGDIERMFEALTIVADVEIKRFEGGRVVLTRATQ